MYDTAAPPDHQTSALRALQLLKSEYLEMPGLRLTVRQASRLIALDADKTQPLLEALVDTGFLRHTPTGFVRA
jgi:DNA-binding IclR family transcriptional regulator